MDLNHRLDRLQRQALELGRKSAKLQQESARLRAHSDELLARLTDTRQALAHRLGPLAQGQTSVSAWRSSKAATGRR